MKRFIAVLSSLLVLPAFAEVAPEYFYEEMMAQYADELPTQDVVEQEYVQEQPQSDIQTTVQTPVAPAATTMVSPRTATGRASTSRAVASSAASRAVSSRNSGTTVTPARTVTARTTTTAAPTTSTTSSRAATTSATVRATAARDATTRTARETSVNTVSSRPSTTVRSTRATTAVNSTPGLTTRSSSQSASTGNTARAALVQTDTVNTPLYVSSRVGVSSTGTVSARVPTVRVGTTSAATTEAVSTTSSATSMDELAQLTDFCKAQYTACMDNFCNVLDDNQGRCSCSANLANYSETETALKNATEELQNVAQQIQYIGLSADQVESLFAQTEAEIELQRSSDTSQLKTSLDRIKSMIVDVESGRASTSSSSGLSFDLSGLLDFSLDSSGFDLANLFGTSTVNTSSISNQRGKQLYETAASRCKASVLTSCQSQGVDISIITNAYDLEIDKACIAYERSLTEANDQMAATVRNASSLLQRARLMVAQQKNAYDLRQCVTELDSCMQDDFVCGRDYENCLDPSGKYIVNGEVVVGSEPGGAGGDGSVPSSGLYTTWNYGSSQNAFIGGGTLSGFISENLKESLSSTNASTSDNIATLLRKKIGYHDDASGKNYGMCMSVLNMCQDLTYDSTKSPATFIQGNNVISEYLTRTLVQVKAKQDTILSDYAEDCISDVTVCLTQNGYDNSNTGAAINNIATRACLSTIKTCMSVNGITGDVDTATVDYDEWICRIMGGTDC